MLQLKNIKKENDIIQANYYPEDSNECGFVKMDCISHEVIERKLTSFDSVIEAYAFHAEKALKWVADLKPIPKEQLVMW